MSHLSDLRAAIVSAFSTVPDIGLVHDRERYVREEKAFRDLYLYEDKNGITSVRGWFVRRVATERRDFMLGGRPVDLHTWQVRGYWAFNDEEGSEIAFDEAIEALRELVRADPTFGGITEPEPASDGEAPTGLQVLDSGPVMFCGVLCHSANLQLRTWSYL